MSDKRIKLHRQIFEIPMGTNNAPAVANLLLLSSQALEVWPLNTPKMSKLEF